MNFASSKLFLIVVFLKWTQGDRTVAMNTDLCQRFPNLDFCKNGPPALPPTPDNQPLDRDTYCRKYQLHYTYFCTTGDNQVANAEAFCAAYKTNCNTKDAPSLWSPQQIKEECAKRKTLGDQFCTGVGESASIKSDCDLYRQYCKGQGEATAAPQQPAPVDLNQYCSSNYPQYLSNCGGGQPPAQPVQPPNSQQNPQAPPTAPGAVSPDQISALCAKNKPLATQFCNGNDLTGMIKQNCDLYNTYCTGGSSRKKRQAVFVPPVAASSSGFCSQFVQTCNNLPAGQQANQLAAFCQRYNFTVDTFCPAYEIAENRIACNAHRYYCQHKAPFRDIDGVS